MRSVNTNNTQRAELVTRRPLTATSFSSRRHMDSAPCVCSAAWSQAYSRMRRPWGWGRVGVGGGAGGGVRARKVMWDATSAAPKAKEQAEKCCCSCP
jgi:hypothetical protein